MTSVKILQNIGDVFVTSVKILQNIGDVFAKHEYSKSGVSFYPCIYIVATGDFLFFDARDCSIECDDGFYYPIIASIQQLASTTFKIISETTRLSRNQTGTECNGSECQCQINPEDQDVAEWEWYFV